MVKLTNIGLVEHAQKALKERWGYVRGSYGQILTEPILQAKLKQCKDDVGRYLDFIKRHYMGRRTADCVNLIKSYLWWDNSKNNPVYQSKYDVNADGMYTAAKDKGPINTIPEIPGVCVWHKGHIGVYIGGGQVIESHGTKYGVIKTPLKGSGATPWTHWLKCPFIQYVEPEMTYDEALKSICEEVGSSYEYWHDKLPEDKAKKTVSSLPALFIKVAKELKK
jgi:hypothetical protein